MHLSMSHPPRTLTVGLLVALVLVALLPQAAGAAPPSDNTWLRPSDWFAHHDASATAAKTDPINVVVYGPHLTGLNVPQQLWSNDTCYSNVYASVPNGSYRVFNDICRLRH